MEGLPLHPVLVHLPLGLCGLIPLVAIIVILGIKLNWFSSRIWLLVVLLQASILAGTVVAKETGEHEEDVVEKIVPHMYIGEHEEAAEGFAVAVGVVLILTMAGAIPKKKVASAAQLLSVAGMLAVIYFAVDAGHSGGDLVYRYGAGRVYESILNPGKDLAIPAGNSTINQNVSGSHNDDDDK